MASEEANQVISIVEKIKNDSAKTELENTEALAENLNPKRIKNVPATKKDKLVEVIVKGKPKSGRFWKEERERFSSVNKTKGLKQDFKKKTALRMELKRTKELSKQALDQLKQKELDRKERRRENLKRNEENQRKAEVVQVITNTAKLKRMRKKQLRFIQKRDTNKAIEATK